MLLKVGIESERRICSNSSLRPSTTALHTPDTQYSLRPPLRRVELFPVDQQFSNEINNGRFDSFASTITTGRGGG